MTTWVNKGYVEKFSKNASEEQSILSVVQSKIHEKFINAFNHEEILREGFKNSKKKSESKKKAEKADNKVNDLQEKQKDLTADKKELEKKIADAQQEIKDSNKELKEKHAESAELKKDLKEAKNDKEQAEKDADEEELVDSVGAGVDNEDDDGQDDDEQDDDEQDDDEQDDTEGFKGKKKKSSKKSGKKSSKKSGKKKSSKKSDKTSHKTIQEPFISSNDSSVLKNMMSSLFSIGFAYLIAHIWYSNFFINTVSSSIADKFNILSQNEIIHNITIYFVLIITKLHDFVMTSLPESAASWPVSLYVGHRFWFFLLFFVFYFYAPQFQSHLSDIADNIAFSARLIKGIFDGRLKSDQVSRQIFQRFGKMFSSIDLGVVTGLSGFLYITAYFKNILFDETKTTFANIKQFPSSVLRIVSGTIFYVIYLVFKFAILYLPTVTAVSVAIFIGFLYYTFIYKNNFTQLFHLISVNNASIHKESILYDANAELSCTQGTFKGFMEKTLRFLFRHAHHLLFLYFIGINALKISSIESPKLLISLIVAGVILIFMVFNSLLETYGIGNKEKQNIIDGLKKVKETMNTPVVDIKEDIFKGNFATHLAEFYNNRR